MTPTSGATSRPRRWGWPSSSGASGRIPYSQITVVDVPEGADGAGGMEYPTLFFTDDAPMPPGVHFPEYVTIHELAHQYFYGLVGSDEVEEAWLDEGLTETMSDWGVSRQFGREGGAWDYFGHHLSVTELSQAGYSTAIGVDPSETRAFEYESNHIYGAVTYTKTVLILRTMEAYLGAEKFEAAMRHYYEKAKFTHPRAEDFVRLFDEGAGQDLSWYWKQTLWGTSTLDYEVMDVEKRRKPAPVGLFDGKDGKREEKESPKKEDKDAPWISEVVVRRKGELAFPVEVKVVFEDETDQARDVGRRARRRAALEALDLRDQEAGGVGRGRPRRQGRARHDALQQRTARGAGERTAAADHELVPERVVGGPLGGGFLMRDDTMMTNRGAGISAAFGRVWERPWLVAALALTNIGLTLVLTAPLSAMLAQLLDKRPAAGPMVAGDDGLWIEFLSDHADVAAVASVALGAGVIVYGLLSWILDGGVLAALALDGERRARGGAAVLAESASRAKRMLVLGLFGLLLRASRRSSAASPTASPTQSSRAAPSSRT